MWTELSPELLAVGTPTAQRRATRRAGESVASGLWPCHEDVMFKSSVFAGQRKEPLWLMGQHWTEQGEQVPCPRTAH